jgi:hypothetical protein
VATELPEADRTCPDCGAALTRAGARTHECEPDDVLDYRLFLDREKDVTLSDELAAFFASPQGQFEVWYAERQRRRGERR